MNNFVVHACEQSLRFSTVERWDDLSEKLQMQMSFNVGVMALGLNLSKEEGYDTLKKVCVGESSMQDFHDHVRSIVALKSVPVQEQNISKPF